MTEGAKIKCASCEEDGCGLPNCPCVCHVKTKGARELHNKLPPKGFNRELMDEIALARVKEREEKDGLYREWYQGRVQGLRDALDIARRMRKEGNDYV